MLFFFFFFSSRRRHTRSDRDWSSDVCSSDLTRAPKCRATLSSSSACAPDSCKREATDTSATGGLHSPCSLRAARVVAADRAELQEFSFRNAQRLVDLRDGLDELVVEGAVRVLRAL